MFKVVTESCFYVMPIRCFVSRSKDRFVTCGNLRQLLLAKIKLSLLFANEKQHKHVS